jgi:SAM-dependent methyltransferase
MDARVGEDHPGQSTFSAGADSCALGYSGDEFRRLRFRGEIFRDFTAHMLRRAGIAPGMRVLDVGCGVGDVSLLAAEMVGPKGFVLGIDRSAAALEVARQRAADDKVRHAWFCATEIDAFSPRRTFDAIIGRLVLAYLPDPSATLRRLCEHLRPGGIVAFQEMASPLVRSVPEGPEFRACCRWILDTFARAGFELDMGGKLFATFGAAGLPAPDMVASARVEGSPQSPVYGYLADVLRSLLPMAERHGVATAAEVAVDSMEERLRIEAVASNACIMLPPLVGAWTRVDETATEAAGSRALGPFGALGAQRARTGGSQRSRLTLGNRSLPSPCGLPPSPRLRRTRRRGISLPRGGEEMVGATGIEPVTPTMSR